ncbi:MAG: hypothetical protein AMXMBFR7_12260 [Planctomycetota bacterium]
MLLIVVFVLVTLLGIGIFQARSAQLELKAAIHYRRANGSRSAADRGLHQAMALLQYDAWGVNESKAFICTEPWSALHDGAGHEFPYQSAAHLAEPDGSVPFFTLTRDGYRRIQQPISRLRRPLHRLSLPRYAERALVPPTYRQASPHAADPWSEIRKVEGGLEWVVNWNADYKRLGAPDTLEIVAGTFDGPDYAKLPAVSGAPFHDEFLPGAFDTYDLWEERLHRNHGRLFPRARGADAYAYGGAWIAGDFEGAHWRWPALKRTQEFDFLDTRAIGDPVYKVFRYELVANRDAGAAAYQSFESGVDPTVFDESGAAMLPPEHPARYLHGRRGAVDIHPRCVQAPLRATHLGSASEGSYVDTRGGALNLNQVNQNAATERYRSEISGDAADYHYREAKWIYVYDDGPRPVSRYAVTVRPEGGKPHANTRYEPPGERPPELLEMASLRRYFEALDRGLDAHGRLRPTTALPIFQARRLPGSARPWTEGLDAALRSHIGHPTDRARPGHGAFASHAELAWFLRKRAFTPEANPDANPGDLAQDASYLASCLTVHAYEWLLDEHWEADRLVLERDASDLHPYGVHDPDRPDGSASLASRRRFLALLDALVFTQGPDDAREGEATGFRFDPRASAEKQREARWAQAGALSYFLSASLDPFAITRWSGDFAPAWWKRQDRTRDESIHLALVNAKPRYASAVSAVDGRTSDRIAPSDLPHLDPREVAHPWSPQLNEVGRLVPFRFADLPRTASSNVALPQQTGAHAWDFPARKSHGFVELVVPAGLPGEPLLQRLYAPGSSWGLHWHLFVMAPSERPRTGRSGNDVLDLPSTRVLCIDRSADPARTENTGGEAGTADARNDPSGWNRIKSFRADSILGGDAAADAMRMDLPGGASFDGFQFRWRTDQPRPLSLRDVGGEREQGSVRKAASADTSGRFHPAQYVLVLFDPNELPGRGAAGMEQIRFGCSREGTTGDLMVLDAVDFPVGARPFEYGYEAVDCRANRDGARQWVRARPSVAVHDSRAYRPASGQLPHDPCTVYIESGKAKGPFESFTGSPAFRFFTRGAGRYHNWCDGLNEFALGHYLPGGEKNWSGLTNQAFVRPDIEDYAGARSWPAAAAWDTSAVATCLGSSVSLLAHGGELPRIPLGWLGEAASADRAASRLLFDPDLRTWGDLMKLAPLEQQMTAGYLGGRAFDVPIEPGMHFLFAADDGLDNDQDGRTDVKLESGWRSAVPEGCYAGDRRAAGRVNLNEVADPAVLYGLAGGTDLEGRAPYLLPLGVKPSKGYVSWTEFAERFTTAALEGTPYSALFWPEHPTADVVGRDSPLQAVRERALRERVDLARGAYVGHAAVYTIRVIGQALDWDGQPMGETRLRATVERTPDGKINILEFGSQGTR